MLGWPVARAKGRSLQAGPGSDQNPPSSPIPGWARFRAVPWAAAWITEQSESQSFGASTAQRLKGSYFSVKRCRSCWTFETTLGDISNYRSSTKTQIVHFKKVKTLQNVITYFQVMILMRLKILQIFQKNLLGELGCFKYKLMWKRRHSLPWHQFDSTTYR